MVNPLYLEGCEDIPNLAQLAERINAAARTVCFVFRVQGWTLPGGQDVPTLVQIDAHLRKLTSEAVMAYKDALRQWPTDDIDGSAEDELFQVWVSPEPTRHGANPLHIEIFMRMV